LVKHRLLFSASSGVGIVGLLPQYLCLWGSSL
jgi:hypothetical protein